MNIPNKINSIFKTCLNVFLNFKFSIYTSKFLTLHLFNSLLIKLIYAL